MNDRAIAIANELMPVTMKMVFANSLAEFVQLALERNAIILKYYKQIAGR